MIHRPPQSSQILASSSSSTGCRLPALPARAHRGPERPGAGATSRKPSHLPKLTSSPFSINSSSDQQVLFYSQTPEGTRVPRETVQPPHLQPPPTTKSSHPHPALTGWHEPREEAIPITQPRSHGHKSIKRLLPSKGSLNSTKILQNSTKMKSYLWNP